MMNEQQAEAMIAKLERVGQEMDRLRKSLDIADRVVARMSRELEASNAANERLHHQVEVYEEALQKISTSERAGQGAFSCPTPTIESGIAKTALHYGRGEL